MSERPRIKLNEDNEKRLELVTDKSGIINHALDLFFRGCSEKRSLDDKVRLLDKIVKEQRKMLASGAYVEKVTRKRLSQLSGANAPKEEMEAIFFTSVVREMVARDIAKDMKKMAEEILREMNLNIETLPQSWKNMGVRYGVLDSTNAPDIQSLEDMEDEDEYEDAIISNEKKVESKVRIVTLDKSNFIVQMLSLDALCSR